MKRRSSTSDLIAEEANAVNSSPLRRSSRIARSGTPVIPAGSSDSKTEPDAIQARRGSTSTASDDKGENVTNEVTGTAARRLTRSMSKSPSREVVTAEISTPKKRGRRPSTDKVALEAIQEIDTLPNEAHKVNQDDGIKKITLAEENSIQANKVTKLIEDKIIETSKLPPILEEMATPEKSIKEGPQVNSVTSHNGDDRKPYNHLDKTRSNLVEDENSEIEVALQVVETTETEKNLMIVTEVEEEKLNHSNSSDKENIEQITASPMNDSPKSVASPTKKVLDLKSLNCQLVLERVVVADDSVTYFEPMDVDDFPPDDGGSLSGFSTTSPLKNNVSLNSSDVFGDSKSQSSDYSLNKSLQIAKEDETKSSPADNSTLNESESITSDQSPQKKNEVQDQLKAEKETNPPKETSSDGTCDAGSNFTYVVINDNINVRMDRTSVDLTDEARKMVDEEMPEKNEDQENILELVKDIADKATKGKENILSTNKDKTDENKEIAETIIGDIVNENSEDITNNLSTPIENSQDKQTESNSIEPNQTSIEDGIEKDAKAVTNGSENVESLKEVEKSIIESKEEAKPSRKSKSSSKTPKFYIKDVSNDDSSAQSALDRQLHQLIAHKASNPEIESSEEDSNESASGFIDMEAEEGEEDTPSEGSNDINEVGESLGSNDTTCDSSSSQDSDLQNSFIASDDEETGLLSGNEYDLENFAKPIKKSRIRKISDSSDELIDETLAKEQPSVQKDAVKEISSKTNKRKSVVNIIAVQKIPAAVEESDTDKMSTEPYGGLTPPSVITVPELSDDNLSEGEIIIINDEDNLNSLEEIKQSVSEKTADSMISKKQNDEILITKSNVEEVKKRIDSQTPNNSLSEAIISEQTKRQHKSSITIQENVNLSNIEETQILQHISKIVTIFCDDLKKQGADVSGNVSLNVSLDFANDGTDETKIAKKTVETNTVADPEDVCTEEKNDEELGSTKIKKRPRINEDETVQEELIFTENREKRRKKKKTPKTKDLVESSEIFIDLKKKTSVEDKGNEDQHAVNFVNVTEPLLHKKKNQNKRKYVNEFEVTNEKEELKVDDEKLKRLKRSNQLEVTTAASDLRPSVREEKSQTNNKLGDKVSKKLKKTYKPIPQIEVPKPFAPVVLQKILNCKAKGGKSKPQNESVSKREDKKTESSTSTAGSFSKSNVKGDQTWTCEEAFLQPTTMKRYHNELEKRGAAMKIAAKDFKNSMCFDAKRNKRVATKKLLKINEKRLP